MNKQQRNKLKDIQAQLSSLISIVTSIKEEEQDKLDNTPENLQNSERYTQMEDAVDYLEEAIDNMEKAYENIDNVS